MTRFRRGLRSAVVWGLSGTTLLWIAFVVFLDLRYDLFPRTTLGGIKILIAVYLVLALVVIPLWAVARWLRARNRHIA